MIESPATNLLLAHKAQRDRDNALHYEAVLLRHDWHAGVITDLGTIATASEFGRGREQKAAKYRDIVFPGGFHYKKYGPMTLGVSDGGFGIKTLRPRG